MILVFGEILFDIFPGFRRMGGAPFNFAFHLKKLGMPVRFVSRIGRDEAGGEILSFLETHGFDPRDLQIDDRRPTGSVRVSLDALGKPDFNIRQGVAYDAISLDSRLAGLLDQGPRLFYFGTLVQRTPGGHQTLQQILSRRPPEMKAFYDVNLRPGCYTEAVILASLKQADLLKLNEEECALLASMAGKTAGTEGFLHEVLDRDALEVIVLTRGAEGSEWILKQGRHRERGRLLDSPIDTVGAGDAFAAVAAVGYLEKWPPEKTLFLAQQLAERICLVKGALPESEVVYEPLRKELRG